MVETVIPSRQQIETIGWPYMLKNMVLSQDFVEENADLIFEESTWISLIRDQRHIKMDFYVKFNSEFSFRIHVLLSRKRISELLDKMVA